MKRANVRSALLVLGSGAALTLSGVAQAHHSDAEFDIGNCVNMSGTVRALEWVYPHTWLWVESRDDTGKVVTWGFEFPSPTQTVNLDKKWSKTAVVKGDKVTVRYSPMKDGRPGGWMHSVTRADGSVLSGAPGRCDRSEPIPLAGKK